MFNFLKKIFSIKLFFLIFLNTVLITKQAFSQKDYPFQKYTEYPYIRFDKNKILFPGSIGNFIFF